MHPQAQGCLLLMALILLWVHSVESTCASNCASCRESTPDDSYCLACADGFETIESGICTQQSMVEHCSIYSQSLSCLRCRPSYQLSFGTCQKMFDGCLVERQGRCALCHPGSLLSSDRQACSIKYLNCLQVDDNSKCTACYPSYTLVNGRCMYSNRGCQRINRDTGLCASCFPGAAELLGYQCVPLSFSNVTQNCYLVAQNQADFACKLCKEGFAPYGGQCLTLSSIVSKHPDWPQKCKDKLYIHNNIPQCIELIFGHAHCIMADFQRKNCLICESNYFLDANQTCRPLLDHFCAQLNGTTCARCKDHFYLKDHKCHPLPPFCTEFTDDCRACIQGFNLKDGFCLDPNCQNLNYITRQCQMCVVNHQLNAEGVCKFIDPNCAEFDVRVDCVKCRGGYKIVQGLCSYIDKNCEVENQQTGECEKCKPFYHYNKEGRLCIPLPDNCFQADISGRCTACIPLYTLLSNYHCLLITAPEHCQMVDQHNHQRCIICEEGYFANRQGACEPLPLFCLRYNPEKQNCVECTANGVMDSSGQCVDKNCKIFDNEGNCLACQQSFEFGTFGKCTVQTKDRFCQQYQYGICKSCSERYYFNFDFECVPVSAFCKTYDPNSGECTSCYEGYQLTELGECRMDLGMINSLARSGDVLGGQACAERDEGGRCIRCPSGYQEVEVSLAEGERSVSCIHNLAPTGSSTCIKLDESGQKCIQCVHRMYVGPEGQCLSIHKDCDQFNETTGECYKCYQGFVISSESGECVIEVSKDANCQIPGEGGCSKCYQRFYYSRENLRCMEVDSLCNTFDENNGRCKTCYDGYRLTDGKCVYKAATPAEPTTQAATDGSSEQGTRAELVGCRTANSQTGECQVCQWGYVAINGTCAQRDPNCQQLQGQNSTICKNCYMGYTPFERNRSKCILTTQLVSNCKQYNDQVQCVKCEPNYVLTPSSSPAFVCNIIDPNCAVYNEALRKCDRCIQGSVLQGRTCVTPVYGMDPQCARYQNGLCQACQEGWELQGYLCGQRPQI